MEWFSRRSKRTGEIKAYGDRSGAELRKGKPGIEIVTERESGGLSRESGTSSRNRVSRQQEGRQLDPKAEEPNPEQQKAYSQEVNA
jgi:hypothetical protein